MTRRRVIPLTERLHFDAGEPPRKATAVTYIAVPTTDPAALHVLESRLAELLFRFLDTGESE